MAQDPRALPVAHTNCDLELGRQPRTGYVTCIARNKARAIPTEELPDPPLALPQLESTALAMHQSHNLGLFNVQLAHSDPCAILVHSEDPVLTNQQDEILQTPSVQQSTPGAGLIVSDSITANRPLGFPQPLQEWQRILRI